MLYSGAAGQAIDPFQLRVLVPSHALPWIFLFFFFSAVDFFRFFSYIRQCKQLFFQITSKYPDLLKSLYKLLLISLALPVLVIRDIFLVQTSQVTACES